MIGTDTKVSRFMAMNQQGILTHCDKIILLSHIYDTVGNFCSAQWKKGYQNGKQIPSVCLENIQKCHFLWPRILAH